MMLIRSLILSALLIVSAQAVQAAEDVEHPKQMQWQFDGVTGKFDRASIQRGYKVYKEVCAACHAMKYKSFRNLQDVGFSEAEVKALAASFTVKDGPNDEGEMFDRPGRPSDTFPSPYANEKAARASNGGAYPPDLSLMVKARHDGANYIYSLMTGYQEPPAGVQLRQGAYYNPYFPGHQIAMPAPLNDGSVEYEDGTPNTKEQLARDLVNYLQWSAEPEMEQRKSMGIKILVFLVIFTAFFYVAKKRIWSRLDQE